MSKPQIFRLALAAIIAATLLFPTVASADHDGT